MPSFYANRKQSAKKQSKAADAGRYSASKFANFAAMQNRLGTCRGKDHQNPQVCDDRRIGPRHGRHTVCNKEVAGIR